MANIALNPNGGFDPFAWVNHQIQTLRNAWQRRTVYHSVMAELSALSDRELEDIGLARGDCRDEALDAAENA